MILVFQDEELNRNIYEGVNRVHAPVDGASLDGVDKHALDIFYEPAGRDAQKTGSIRLGTAASKVIILTDSGHQIGSYTLDSDNRVEQRK